MKDTTTCSICHNDIPIVGGWALGHNAEPVNAGRCCDICNDTVVIPARMGRGGRLGDYTQGYKTSAE